MGKEEISTMEFLLVAVGGFSGAILRFIISKKLNHRFRLAHFGTFIVNVFGSLALGFLVNLSLHTNIILFIGIGFLGAFTTFSTFKLESITFLQSRQNKQLLLYLLLTYTLGILFAFIGFWLAEIYLS